MTYTSLMKCYMILKVIKGHFLNLIKFFIQMKHCLTTIRQERNPSDQASWANLLLIRISQQEVSINLQVVFTSFQVVSINLQVVFTSFQVVSISHQVDSSSLLQTGLVIVLFEEVEEVEHLDAVDLIGEGKFY